MVAASVTLSNPVTFVLELTPVIKTSWFSSSSTTFSRSIFPDRRGIHLFDSRAHENTRFHAFLDLSL